MACVNKGMHDWCRVEKRLCLAGTERTCKNKKPKTNADRIRSMSDEELADWHETCPHIDEECTMKGCLECVLEWLQRPWEET